MIAAGQPTAGVDDEPADGPGGIVKQEVGDGADGAITGRDRTADQGGEVVQHGFSPLR
jgi:hypothetical protein